MLSPTMLQQTTILSILYILSYFTQPMQVILELQFNSSYEYTYAKQQVGRDMVIIECYQLRQCLHKKIKIEI